MGSYIESPQTGTYGAYVENNNYPFSGFNGNFGSLFTGVLQSIQTDLGLTYGGTLLAAGTTPPVITLTGFINSVPVPITVACTLLGALGVWTGSISYNGGASISQTFTSAATVPLTGAGAGLILNIAAGSAAVDNTWKATCAALADQSGNGINIVQPTAAAQPIITPGLNGVAAIGTDGVNQYMKFTLDLPAPGTTPTFFWYVARVLALPAASGVLIGDASGSSLITFMTSANTNMTQYNGSSANIISITLNSWFRGEVYFSASASDYQKIGATSSNLGSAGIADPPAGRGIFAENTGGAKLSGELLAFVTTNNKPTAAQLSAASTAAVSFYGGSVNI